MSITYNFEDVRKTPFPRRLISKWIKDTIAFYGKKAGDISYIFCSDEYILDINRRYLDHDYYTDIITFDYTEKEVVSGDIFISTDTVKSNAELYNQGYAEELYRVIIHGVLHLCGQKDKTGKERLEMTRKEDLALKQLSVILSQ